VAKNQSLRCKALSSLGLQDHVKGAQVLRRGTPVRPRRRAAGRSLTYQPSAENHDEP